jgi:ABC-type transport system involved in multi-copper enzyme maturation permease subunit
VTAGSQLTAQPHPAAGVGSPVVGRPRVWWLVLKQELLEMWAGGRVLNFLAIFSLLMSVTAFLLATNNDLNLLPIKATIVVALTSAITFGLFIGLVIAAESISGERERATLEPLLLTPSSHREIILGKFLAAMSPWPAALVVSAPYVVVLSRGDPILGTGLVLGAVTGTMLALSFVGFGLLMSIWSDSSRVSLFVGLLVYAASLIPSQLPTEFLNSPAGVLISTLDPVESSAVLLTRTLTDGRPLGDEWLFLVAPAVVTALILVVLFWYAAPRLRLTAGE